MTKGLFICTAVLTLAFLVGHIAGLREFTSVLSGTYPATEASVFLGLIYAITHMAFFIAAPILAIGAGILFLFDRCTKIVACRGGQS